MADPVLYGTPLSTFVRAARIALAEKDVAYRHVDVGVLDGECQGAEHRARHPFGKVPALEHDGFRVYETAAITRYIDEAFVGTPLQPFSPRDRARMTQAIAIQDSYGYNAFVLGVAGYHLFAEFVGGQDAARHAAGMEMAATCLDAFEALMGDDPYLAGGAFSLADLYVAPALFYVSLTPDADALIGRRPKLAAWWARVSERPHFQATAPQLG